MRVTTEALVLRENNNVGESDRFVTLLTPELGIIRASARGAQNMKSRAAVATRQFSYAKMTLFQGRDKYIVDEAEPLRLFFDVGADIEKLALGQYFCELTCTLLPPEEPAPETLRMLLNALHFLTEGSRDTRLIKAAVELWLMSAAGYRPALGACARCGVTEGERVWFSPMAGHLLCENCPHPADAIALSGGVVAAMRCLTSNDLSRIFRFTLPDAAAAILADVSEKFLTVQLGRGFYTLDFYHEISR